MSDEATEPAVLTERRDNVLVITINRPDQRNAVNKAVSEGVAAAVDELDGDDGLSLAILTGAGRGFCAGMDLKAFAAGETPWHDTRGFGGIIQQANGKYPLGNADLFATLAPAITVAWPA